METDDSGTAMTTCLEMRNEAASMSLSVPSTSGENQKSSDLYATDAPRQVPSLEHRLELAQEELDIDSLKISSPSPLYGSLQVGISGFRSIRITSRISHVTDGHPTNPLPVSGSDDYDPDKKKKNEVTAIQAANIISSKSVSIDCVPVGDADVKEVLEIGQDAFKTDDCFRAIRESNPDKSQTVDGATASPHTSTPLKQSVPSSFLMPYILPWMKKLAKINRSTASKVNELDDPDVKLPSLGSLGRGGPDWDRSKQDDDGPGTISSHHANKTRIPDECQTEDGATASPHTSTTLKQFVPSLFKTSYVRPLVKSPFLGTLHRRGPDCDRGQQDDDGQGTIISDDAKKKGLPVGFDRNKSIICQSDSILGYGCYGTIVYKGRFDKRDVAVKRLQKEYFNFADREMELLRQSDQHPNVIRYYWNEKDDHFLYIALELCEGTLQDYIEDNLGNIKKLEPVELLHQTMKGLAHLHSLGIVHMDLKPHNILISRPGAESGVRPLISDFGFSRKLPPGKMSFSSKSGFQGTEGWAAPEMSITDQNKTLAVDIFSAGCVMYYVLTRGKHPFGKESYDIQYHIHKGKFKLNDLPSTSDGYIAKDIIQDMLSRVPGARPTAKAVLQHLLFWNKDDKLRFIEATSDRIETKTVPGIENPKEIFDLDWTKPLSQELKDVLQNENRYKIYETSAVQDLLRFIRNKRHHYNRQTADVQSSLGSVPDEYLDYFTSRFPLLLLHTYRVMKHCSEEDAFKAYYKHA